MNIQDKLLNNLSKHYLNTAIKKVVRNLQILPKEVMQSGDDSLLKNAWDEIYLQVQQEYFLSWKLYEEMIRNICIDKNGTVTKETWRKVLRNRLY